MVRRYAHFAPAQLRSAANRLATFWSTGPREPRAISTQPRVDSLVPAVGIEPTTNGLQNAFEPTLSIFNQTLAALANLETSVIKAQLRHSQSGDGTSQANRVQFRVRLGEVRCYVAATLRHGRSAFAMSPGCAPSLNNDRTRRSTDTLGSEASILATRD
jgi:hypothetical protein